MINDDRELDIGISVLESYGPRMFGPTSGYASTISGAPASASISASASVADLCLTIPRSSSMPTTFGILCVLQWGLSLSGLLAMRSIWSRFCESTSRKMTNAGVMIRDVSAMR